MSSTRGPYALTGGRGCEACPRDRRPDPAYRERLTVPLRWWVQGTMLVATLWLALVVAVPGPVAWVVTAVAMLLLGTLLTSFGSRPDRGRRRSAARRTRA